MLFDLFQPKLSPKGSNIRIKEEAAIMYWLDLLQDIQGDRCILLIGMFEYCIYYFFTESYWRSGCEGNNIYIEARGHIVFCHRNAQ